jgi:hypothetical protein
MTFANVRLNKGTVQLGILILAYLLGLILLAQPSTHSQVGEQPQQRRPAISSLRVTASNRNPLQIALLHCYDANLTTTFNVSHAPVGLAFDGANTWVTNYGDGSGNTVTKLQASDSATLGTVSVGESPKNAAFDCANI